MAHVEAVTQHHANRHDLSQGVRDALARDVGRTAMARLIQSNAVTQGSACKHAQRTRDLSSLVGQNITKHVFGNHYIEISGTADKLHCRVVYQQIFELNIGIFFCANSMNDFAPHAAGLQNVSFVDAGNLLAALAGSLECLTGNALNLIFTILKRIVCALARFAIGACALFVVETLALTKIQTAGKLANNHHVYAIDHLRLQGRGLGQCVENLNGA